MSASQNSTVWWYEKEKSREGKLKDTMVETKGDKLSRGVCGSGGSVYKGSFTIPEQFSQEELSDLIKDLNLSKNASEILAYQGLKTKIVLMQERK